MAQPRIDISQLSLPELQDLYDQLKAELESFSRQMLALQETAGRFASTGQALEGLKERKQGQPVLLPMTESLYVPGTMESVDNVMLEIGTGYYIEKDVDGAVDYCRRKVNLVRENVETVAAIIGGRQQALAQIQAVAKEKAAAAGAS